ncbi:MAG: quinone-dependent dihydroorotate dehydrogenase [Pseudomonadota bacterium]
MGGLAWRALRPAIFALDAEAAHGLALSALKNGLIRPSRARGKHTGLRRTLAGLNFPNPLGMAAGFDKNGEVALEVLAQGFGFVELGTTTPRPQAGNPKPRIFRLVDDGGLINRLGFNNEGHDLMAGRLEELPPKGERAGPIGINIGANKDSEDRGYDYVLGIERFANLADYITVNVSSPNTPGLRDLQGEDELKSLLARVLDAREKALSGGQICPFFVKIAPDLDEIGLDASLRAIDASGVEGIIVSNTTFARPNSLKSARRAEQGGLSGKPLFEASTAMLRTVRERVGSKMVLVGVGGIDSPESAKAKLDAGADLLQLYTGYVFQGPGLVAEILDALNVHLDSFKRSA